MVASTAMQRAAPSSRSRCRPSVPSFAFLSNSLDRWQLKGREMVAGGGTEQLW